jgi:hypothetical protein
MDEFADLLKIGKLSSILRLTTKTSYKLSTVLGEAPRKRIRMRNKPAQKDTTPTTTAVPPPTCCSATDFVNIETGHHPSTGIKCIIMSQIFPCHSSSIYLNVENISVIVSTNINGALEINKEK